MSLDTYRMNLELRGHSRRDRNINIFKHTVEKYAPDNPAYKEILLEGESMYVIINAQDDYAIKEVVPMPGIRIPLGSMIEFHGQPWIVTMLDFDDEIYSKCRMYQCSCKLKWKDKTGNIFSYDCYSEDATKYSEGVEYSERVRIGEFQLKCKIKLDEITCLLNRDMRFIIDVDKYMTYIVANDDRPYVYRVTRRNIVTGTYADEGYIEITLVQDQWIEGRDDYVNMLAAQPWELKEPYEENTESSDGEGETIDPTPGEGGWL